MSAENETLADIVVLIRKLPCVFGYRDMNALADRIDAAAKRELDELRQQLPQPDPDWREICEKCHDGGEPPDCEYFGEPDGCNSPIYGEHPRTQCSNMAKMREALILVQKKIKFLIGSLTVPNSLVANRMEINGIINAALSAPARNCDVGTAEEQAQRFYNFHTEHSSAIQGMCDFRCPCIDSGDKCHCLCKWAQMPYEEGGAK